MTFEQEVAAFIDRQKITDILYRYCRAMDTNDRELGYSLWHEDSHLDYGAEHYQGDGRGFIDWVIAAHERVTISRSHNVTNVIIELDGDRATSEAYYNAVQRMKTDTPTQLSSWGRYLDTWSRRDGRWAIERRIVRTDFDELREVTPMSEAGRPRLHPGD